MDVRRAVQRIAREAVDLDDGRRRVDALLQQVVGYDFAAFSTVDPATGLWTSCYVSGLDADGSAEREQVIFESELSGDVNAFAELARRPVPAASLHLTTGGKLEYARRWAPLLEAYDVVDELRAVLNTGGSTWGTLVLYRAGTSQPFTSVQLTTLTDALPDLAALFRLMLVRLALAGAHGQDELAPGAFTVLPDGTLTGVSTAARAWLETLDDRGRVPAAIRAAAAAARVRGSTAVVSLPCRGGGFVALHSSPVEGSDAVAVVVGRAPTFIVSDVLADAYGLTSRERDVAAETALGKSTRDIARTLRITPFTVTDHLKSLYRKVDVASRNELVAAMNQRQHPRQRQMRPALPSTCYLDHNIPTVAHA